MNSKHLQLEIDRDIQAIKEKQAQLRKLQAIEDANAPMRDSKVGRAYLSVIKGMTGWFAEVNRRADVMLTDPMRQRSEVLLRKSDALLAYTRELPGREHKKAAKTAVKCAELVMLIENLIENHELVLQHELEQAVVNLDGEVQRLRPVKDEAKEQKLKELVESAAAELQGLAKENNNA